MSFLHLLFYKPDEDSIFEITKKSIFMYDRTMCIVNVT